MKWGRKSAPCRRGLSNVGNPACFEPVGCRRLRDAPGLGRAPHRQPARHRHACRLTRAAQRLALRPGPRQTGPHPDADWGRAGFSRRHRYSFRVNMEALFGALLTIDVVGNSGRPRPTPRGTPSSACAISSDPSAPIQAGSLFADRVEVLVPAQIDVVVHQCWRGIEAVIQCVCGQYVELRSGSDHNRGPVASATDEQRRSAGFSAGRMQRDFHHGLLGSGGSACRLL